MRRNQRSVWKYWGVGAFCLAGVIYITICLWGDIKYIDAFNLPTKLGVGISGSLASCVLCSCFSASYMKCKTYLHQRREVAKLKERLLISVSDDAFKQSNRWEPSYQVAANHFSHQFSDTWDQAWHEHSIKCNKLVQDFFQSSSVGTGALQSYLVVAHTLRSEYHTLLDSQYYTQLKAHGYDYHSMPADLFMQIIPATSAPIIIMQPDITPPESPKSSSSNVTSTSPDEHYIPTKVAF